MTANSFTEESLYLALHRFFASEGFEIRGEVKHCDLAAKKTGPEGEEWLVVEIKKTMTLKLLAQALKRRTFCPNVYVAVPRPDNMKRVSPYSDFKTVAKKLGLGLLLVSFTPGGVFAGPPNNKRTKIKPSAKVPRTGLGMSQVQVVHLPALGVTEKSSKKSSVKKKKLSNKKVLAFKKEWEGRSGDYNSGGITRRKLITAYRENAIHLAVLLESLGPKSPKALRASGGPEKTPFILRQNYYGWFDNVDRGLYALSQKGRTELSKNYLQIAEHFRNRIQERGALDPV